MQKIRNISLKKFDFRNIFSLVWKSTPKWTLLNIFSSVFLGILPLLVLFFLKKTIDAVVFEIIHKTNSYTLIIEYLAITGIIILISAILKTLSNWIQWNHTHYTENHVYTMIHNKINELDLSHFENSQYYDLLYRARYEASYRPAKIIYNCIKIFQNTISLFFIAGLLFYLHWLFVAGLLISMLPTIVVKVKFSTTIFRLSKKQAVKERKSNYYHSILTSNRFAKEFMQFSLIDLFVNRFNNLRKEIYEEKQEVYNKRLLKELASQIVSVLVVVTAFIYIAYSAIKGQITQGDMVLYFFAFQRGLEFLREILGGLAGLYEDKIFLTSLTEFMEIKPNLEKNANSLKKFPDKIEKEICFKNVNFTYPTSERKVFEDFNLTIPVGKTVAIVGVNGAGKSTFIKLLCRFYDVNEGEVLIDGENIKHIELNELRKNISVLFQDFVGYNLSASENIWLGNTEKSDSNEEEISKIANIAGIQKFIENLPKKYQTILGNLFEKGEDLSTGEWQKLAIARMLYSNKQVLIFDEPTSYMDIASEKKFFQNLKQFSEGKTVILISHKLSNIKYADLVYLIDNNKVAAFGTYTELIGKLKKYG